MEAAQAAAAQTAREGEADQAGAHDDHIELPLHA